MNRCVQLISLLLINAFVVLMASSSQANPYMASWFKVPQNSLNLNFMTGSLPIQVQFSRASGTNVTPGTYYNSSGVLTTATSNMIIQSQNFSTSWSLGTPYIAVTTNATTAPDGTTTGNQISVTNNPTSGTGASVQQNHGLTSGTNTYTFSVYLKSTGSNCSTAATGIQLAITGGTTVASRACFNLVTGAYAGPCGGTPTGASITSAGNGWYRISVSATDNATGNSNLATYIQPSYVGGDTCSIYAWGAQLEQNSSPTSYVYTTTAIAYSPRFDYNPSTLSLKGLLIEEARTNLAFPSAFAATGNTGGNASIVSSSALNPDGTTTMSLVDNTTNARHFTNRNVTITAGAAYSYSIYLKANTLTSALVYAGKSGSPYTRGGMTVNLSNGTFTSANVSSPSSVTNQSVTAVGNGWYRVAMTVIIDATSTDGYMEINTVSGSNSTYAGTGTGSIYLWGAQIEAGGIPTSYIPTTTTAVTRNADVAMVNSTSWLNSSLGTFYMQYMVPYFQPSTINQIILNLSGSTRITPRLNGGTEYVDTPQTALFPGSPTVNQVNRTAVGYIANNYSCSLNGASPSTNTTNSVPASVTQLQLGNISSSQYLDGWLQSVQYFGARLSDAQVRTLSVNGVP